MLTLKDIAEYLKVTVRTVCRMANVGKLPGFKVGGSWCFKHTVIEEWIKAQSNNNNGKALDVVFKAAQ